MPGKNGYQICREIKKSDFTKDIPVILVTSKGQESDKFWGKKQGADDYIVKPFQIDDLINAVKRFVK
jgi:twitching motility two-component system response regulator PilH